MSLTLVCVLLVALGHAEATLQQYPFRNTSLPLDERVKVSERTVKRSTTCTASERYILKESMDPAVNKLVLLTAKICTVLVMITCTVKPGIDS